VKNTGIAIATARRTATEGLRVRAGVMDRAIDGISTSLANTVKRIRQFVSADLRDIT
jgi:hypothetical protein